MTDTARPRPRLQVGNLSGTTGEARLDGTPDARIRRSRSLDAQGNGGEEGEICIDLRDPGRSASCRATLDDDGRAPPRRCMTATTTLAMWLPATPTGYLTYVGRMDDVFKSSDYSISPFEIESVLIEHRGGGGSCGGARARMRCGRHPADRVCAAAEDDFRKDSGGLNCGSWRLDGVPRANAALTNSSKRLH